MTTGVYVVILYQPKQTTRENNDESRGVNIPPISIMPKLIKETGRCLFKLTLANANQAFFMPTCPGQQPKTTLEMKTQTFKWKEHEFGYRQTTAL